MLDLTDLNEQQRRAVTFSGNNAVLVAGAGSGKTRTLVYRTAYILEQGINPQNIMVTTFTKSASEEMIDRVGKLVGEGVANRLEIGTSHSIFYGMYRRMYTKTHYANSAPMLAMGGECYNIIKSGLFRLKLIDTVKTMPAMEMISFWKNEGLTPKQVEKMLAKRVEDLLEQQNGSLSLHDQKRIKIWNAQLQAYRFYEDELARRNKIDFDDMLYKTYHLLLKNEAELSRLRKRFKYIMVDEAQDLNLIQYKLTELISADNKNAMLIGDDYQTIYGFRGSKVNFLMDYVERNRPDLLLLESNYRSTYTIVHHSNKLIKENKIQLQKNVITANKEGKPIEVMMSESNLMETHQLPDLIDYLLERGYRYSDIAILYRVNAQALLPAFKFIERRIPHKIYSKESIYDANEIKEILTYIRLFMRPHEVTPKDFIKIMNKPSRYLNTAFGEALMKYCKLNDCSPIEALGDEAWLRQHAHNNAFRDLVNLRNMIFNRFTYYVESGKPTFGAQVNWIYEETGYKEYQSQNADAETTKGDSDGEMVAEVFVQLLQNFESLDALEEFIETIRDSDEKPKTEHVRLMTIHTSKGREFPVVIILGACSRLYPHHANEDLEEERRVMYVGVTRAKKRLFISAIAGKYGRYQVGPTRFIREMGLSVDEPFRFE